MRLLLALALICIAVAQTSYKKATDTNTVLSQSQFTCIKNGGFNVVFVRAYKPDGDGSFDQNVVSNVNNAIKAGISTEVYMEIQPNSTKWGFEQADEVNKALKKNAVNVRRIWVMVKNPSMWSSNQINNCGFINEVLMRNRQNGYTAAVYTNANDWNQITGNWNQAGDDVDLWYWNVAGAGSSGESPQNFNDFTPFGAWTSAKVKQYGQQELICSLFLNVDVYAG